MKVDTSSDSGSQGRKRTRQQREQTHDGDPSENSGGVTESEATTSDDEDTGCETEGSGEGDFLDEDPEDNTVDVTLEFFDPRESDFLGLKALLQSFLDGQVYAGSELADTVIQQSSVGTVVKAGEEEDPIGVLTVLNTQRYRALESLKQICNFLERNCADESKKAAILKAWNSKGTGFLLSERLINCPPQLGPPLQQALFDEIQWATEDEPSQELRDSFKLDNFIALSRVFADPVAPTSATKKNKRQDVGHLSVTEEPDLVYCRPEDEFYHKHSFLSYSFPSEKLVATDELQPRRLVMLLTMERIKKARQELDEVVGNVAANDS